MPIKTSQCWLLEADGRVVDTEARLNAGHLEETGREFGVGNHIVMIEKRLESCKEDSALSMKSNATLHASHTNTILHASHPVYEIKYSKDSGKTWQEGRLSVNGNLSLLKEGKEKTFRSFFQSLTSPDTIIKPGALFETGPYLVRIECHHQQKEEEKTSCPISESAIPSGKFSITYTADKHKKQNRKWIDGNVRIDRQTGMVHFYSDSTESVIAKYPLGLIFSFR